MAWMLCARGGTRDENPNLADKMYAMTAYSEALDEGDYPMQQCQHLTEITFVRIDTEGAREHLANSTQLEALQVLTGDYGSSPQSLGRATFVSGLVAGQVLHGLARRASCHRWEARRECTMGVC